eukprot:CAMPEP_0172385044 /NCGR_PEP_ID=MMETSP1061-20121228/2719_1 /TAXON_ID=37318 /ORGANISM="Pseudo-nitzschia pungens, Strain cf. pungens" /LENGTH=537 /DNA_ID=CAMNT_0013113869 /DNA_START=13 /DNA_END=1628 /DNA_ORIENTATION=+
MRTTTMEQRQQAGPVVVAAGLHHHAALERVLPLDPAAEVFPPEPRAAPSDGAVDALQGDSGGGPGNGALCDGPLPAADSVSKVAGSHFLCHAAATRNLFVRRALALESSDLSFDAVVKYFACGFFICTSGAIVYEWLVDTVATWFLELVDKLASEWLFESVDTMDPLVPMGLEGEHHNNHHHHHHHHQHGHGSSNYHNMIDPLWYQLTRAILRALVNAFVVAALTEEICKYMCFWMVEHPDLEIRNRVLLQNGTRQSNTEGNDNDDDDDDDDNDNDNEDSETTGLLSRSRTRVPSTFGMTMRDETSGSYSESNNFDEDSSELVVATGLHSRANGLLSRAHDPDQQLQWRLQRLVYAPVASLVSIGEGITIAMVTVALGLACAENLLYIFVYTPKDLASEVGTLYLRCLLPVHPMAAALQSIGVCRRDLEKDHSYGIGWIIFPAWLLHGCFDSSLMVLSAVRKVLEVHNIVNDYGIATSPPGMSPGEWETVDDDRGLLSSIVVTAIPCIGILYYLNESNYQRERLEQLDKENRMQSVA